MNKIAIAVAVSSLLVAACTSSEDQRREWANADTNNITSMIQNSKVLCIDGNKIRFVYYLTTGSATAFTAWTVLDQNGKPIRCTEI